MSISSHTPAHVLITGASSGIGHALALRYAAPGRRLSLGGRDRARLQHVGDLCAARGAEVHLEICDVTDADAVERWVTARDDVQPIDLLIANAGLGGAATMAPASGESGPLARQIFSVNTIGVINTVTALLSRMVQRQRGHIVMVSSLAGYLGVPDAPVYSASKAAVRVYGDGIRRLVRSAHVTVTVVSPGFVKTPMSASLPAQGAFEWSVDRAADYIVARVSKGARQVVFPWPLRLGAALANALPAWFVDRCLHGLRLPPK